MLVRICVAAGFMMLACVGCGDPPSEKSDELENQLRVARTQIAQLENQLADAQEARPDDKSAPNHDGARTEMGPPPPELTEEPKAERVTDEHEVSSERDDKASLSVPDDPVTVRYENGKMLRLRGLECRYEFGAAESEPDRFFFYNPIVVSKRAFNVRKRDGDVTKALVFPFDSLSRISWKNELEDPSHDYDAGYGISESDQLVPDNSLPRTITSTATFFFKDGTSVSGVYLDYLTLTERKCTFKESCTLVAKTDAGDDFRRSLKLIDTLYVSGEEDNVAKAREFLANRISDIAFGTLEIREWTSTSGTTASARLLEVIDEETIALGFANGSSKKVSLSALSDQDQKYARMAAGLISSK